MKTAPVHMVVGGLWLLAAATGIWVLLRYENGPGPSGLVPHQWPAESRIGRPHDRLTLVMFAHPKCPCTRASIDELNRLLVRCEGKVATTVLFAQPGNMPLDWARGASWNRAAAISGVSVQADLDGHEARRFGAETSGFTVLYGPEGHLLFAGGITAGRGHAGDSAGARAIALLVAGASTKPGQAPVFGCALLDRCVSAN